MNYNRIMYLYDDARREGWDHWESVWFAICDATL